MSNFLPNRDPDVVQLMELWSHDTASWCVSMFPERFNRPFSPVHRKLFNAIDNDNIQKLVVICFRGFGKTSILHLGYQSKEICLRNSPFIVPVSATNTGAVLQSENLKRELMTNRRIKGLFGDLRSKNFSKDQWVTSTASEDMKFPGTMVFPRGRGQQVRGNLFGNERPKTILVDDFEDAESVMSEEQRAKYKEWFFTDLMGSVDASSTDWRCIVIGTLLHEDSLLANLIEDPSWTTINIPLCDENFHSVWPEFMTDEQVKNLSEDFRRQGMIDGFYREYMNQIISTEDAPFQKNFIKFYEESEEKLWKRQDIETVILVDPAKTLNPRSADSAIVGVGLSREKQALYVRDCINGRLMPTEVIDNMFSMAERLKARYIGYEVTSLNEWISQPIRNEISRHGSKFELVELKARGKKEERVRSLITYYRRGLVYHNKTVTKALEDQLLSFPRSKKWDLMDALAYVVPMMDAGEVLMMPSNDEDSGIYASKDEYDGLGYEEDDLYPPEPIGLYF